jgi:RNA polymerase sigma-70 factor (ECF subfamily)
MSSVMMSHLAFAIDMQALPGWHRSMTDDSLPVVKPAQDERELLRRIRQGEIERYADLIDHHQRQVTRIVRRRVPSDCVSEVVHDVFVRAYVNLGQFSESVPFDHWLAGIAIRTCYDFWRDRARHAVPVSSLTEEHHRWIEQTLSVHSDAQFRRQTETRDAAEVLEWALQQLSPENRAVLTLVHLDGYSVREAAQLLGWTLVNVKVRAHRARQALRNILRHISFFGSAS